VTPEQAPPVGERPLWRQLAVPVTLFAIVLIGLLLGLAPTPYVIERPGPVYDTLGTTTVDDKTVSVIEVDGHSSYPTQGRLDLLTVYIDGSRDHPTNWFTVIGGWLNPRHAVVPIDHVYPIGETSDQADERSAIAMQGSHETATAAALGELGIAYESYVTVLLVGEGDPADGVLEVDDEVLAINGQTISSDTELRAAIADAGVGAELELRIRRGGAERTVSLTTQPRSASDATPVVGIVPGVRLEFPFEVEIQLQRVGGSSAGMMFALGIYDTLTPGALTGGEHIAGTGTVTPSGQVGVIGGVRQKMVGARDAGADWFLVAQANCGEVVGNVPDGLRVVAVSTFTEAVDAVRVIGTGEGVGALPTCN
jgi:PDZ domain-containing protein